MPFARLDSCGPRFGGRLSAGFVAINVVPGVSRTLSRFQATNTSTRGTAVFRFQVGSTFRGPFTVGPGQSIDIDLTAFALVQTWNPNKFNGMWDGVTVHCQARGFEFDR